MKMCNMETTKKHANIPIFIPHEGCPNACVFCNQKKIAGTCEKANRNIVFEIEKALSTIDTQKYDVQIAFFGGSFTGIPRETMIDLLNMAKPYIDNGRVSSLRLSTRPDYIDREILEILKEYNVLDIEIGIQSMSDRVLSSCKRNHVSEQSVKACEMIVKDGFRLTGQMMIGLPNSTLDDEIDTAKKICEMKAYSSRIYPTVVLKDTELFEMTKRGSYTPLNLENAIFRTSEVYEIFLQNNVKVLRVGLQSSEILQDKNEAIGDTTHCALGELCESDVYYKRILNELVKNNLTGNTLYIHCKKGETSKVLGHKKKNKIRLNKNIVVIEEETYKKFEISVHAE